MSIQTLALQLWMSSILLFIFLKFIFFNTLIGVHLG